MWKITLITLLVVSQVWAMPAGWFRHYIITTEKKRVKFKRYDFGFNNISKTDEIRKITCNFSIFAVHKKDC